MTTITLIGAGSAEFAAELVTDFLSVDALPEGEFRLVDIDPVRLDLACRFAEHLIERTGKGWTVRADVDRTAVLPGSDVVINTIEVAGMRNVRHDYDIPMRYGVDQCIGDTIGPGGLFKAFRTIPAWLEILRDIDFLGEGKLVVRHHHERWDGTGYPDQLARDDIPLAARVFAVADTLDALTTDRPYRRGTRFARARVEIREHAGSQFDPDVIAAFDTISDDTFAALREGNA